MEEEWIVASRCDEVRSGLATSNRAREAEREQTTIEREKSCRFLNVRGKSDGKIRVLVGMQTVTGEANRDGSIYLDK